MSQELCVVCLDAYGNLLLSATARNTYFSFN